MRKVIQWCLALLAALSCFSAYVVGLLGLRFDMSEDFIVATAVGAIGLAGIYSMGCFKSIYLVWPELIYIKKPIGRGVWIVWAFINIIYVILISVYAYSWSMKPEALPLCIFGVVFGGIGYFTSCFYFYGIKRVLPKSVLKLLVVDLAD